MVATSGKRGRPPKGQAAADRLPQGGPVQTAAQVGLTLGLAERTVRRYAASGQLHSLRLAPRVVRFAGACVTAHLHGRSCAELRYADEVLTAEQAADLLGVGLATLLNAAHQAIVPCLRAGNSLRFSRAALLVALCPPSLPSPGPTGGLAQH
ncbi:DNA-binding protein [Sphaerisporangium album]|uniref:DNA-binding protein n=1 Tax=Sphaerisporangium album TaxID=509200 RepID=A0A367EKI4_9ACTN|nr:helix-turn-helix domain-containing protein [Sphaerisporangium album]RCG18232.1 DNA-binding protein [Sphaerisporangium album]